MKNLNNDEFNNYVKCDDEHGDTITCEQVTYEWGVVPNTYGTRMKLVMCDRKENISLDDTKERIALAEIKEKVLEPKCEMGFASSAQVYYAVPYFKELRDYIYDKSLVKMPVLMNVVYGGFVYFLVFGVPNNFAKKVILPWIIKWRTTHGAQDAETPYIGVRKEICKSVSAVRAEKRQIAYGMAVVRIVIPLTHHEKKAIITGIRLMDALHPGLLR